MDRVVVAEIVKCVKCGRGLGEHYGYFVLVRYRGLRVRMYGPGRIAIDCAQCGETTTPVVDTRRNNGHKG